MERIGLKEAISVLRSELTASILTSADEQLRFEVGEVTLEFQVNLERSAQGSGKVSVWVIEVGTEGAITSGTTHTVRIPLKPLSASGQPILTGGKSTTPE